MRRGLSVAGARADASRRVRACECASSRGYAQRRSDEARSITAAGPLMASTSPSLNASEGTSWKATDIDQRAPAAPAPRPHVDRQELAAIFAGGVHRRARARGARAEPGRGARAPGRGRRSRSTSPARSLLGYFVTRLQERLPPSLYRRAFLGTGICGALSTFSTMMVELLRMLDRRPLGARARRTRAASIAGGFAVVFLATKLVRRARLTGELPAAVARRGPARRARRARALRCSTGSSRPTTDARFPLGTLLVNLSGALVLGVLVGVGAARRRLPARGHGRDRLLHDLLDVDARVPSPRRGRTALAVHRQRDAEPAGWASARPRSGGCSGAGDDRGRAAA